MIITWHWIRCTCHCAGSLLSWWMRCMETCWWLTRPNRAISGRIKHTWTHTRALTVVVLLVCRFCDFYWHIFVLVAVSSWITKVSMLSCVSGLWVWLSGSYLNWATSPTDTTLTDRYWPMPWGSSSCDCPNHCSKCPWLSAGEMHTKPHIFKLFNRSSGERHKQQKCIIHSHTIKSFLVRVDSHFFCSF